MILQKMKKLSMYIQENDFNYDEKDKEVNPWGSVVIMSLQNANSAA
jgi:hypothetical protein